MLCRVKKRAGSGAVCFRLSAPLDPCWFVPSLHAGQMLTALSLEVVLAHSLEGVITPMAP